VLVSNPADTDQAHVRAGILALMQRDVVEETISSLIEDQIIQSVPCANDPNGPALLFEGPNYDGVEGTVRVSRHGTPMTVLYPQKRQYYVQHSATTEAAIEMHYGSNILVALGEDLKGGKWSVRIQVRPLVNLVWLAAFIMAVGGWISLFDRRYRIPKTAQDAAPGAVTPSGIAGEHAR